MTEQSTAQLERDAERVRSELADTAERIKQKMSPGQLMDEMVDYLREGDARRFASNLKTQIRDNPLALAMVGGGLAWLMFGSGQSGYGSTSRDYGSRRFGTGSEAYGAGSSTFYGTERNGRTGSESSEDGYLSRAKDAAGSAAGTVSDTLGQASGAVSSRLHGLRDSAGHGLAGTARSGAEMGQRARSTVLDIWEREPLVVGALGLAVGAAVGAMLPATRGEREYLGEASAKAEEAVEEALAEGVHEATHAMQGASRAARGEDRDEMKINKGDTARLSTDTDAAKPTDTTSSGVNPRPFGGTSDPSVAKRADEPPFKV